MNTMIEVTAAEEKKDIQLIRQMQLFDDITEDDIRKTIWILNKYVHMIDIIRNYEAAQKEMQNGMDAYQLLAAEGTVAKSGIVV